MTIRFAAGLVLALGLALSSAAAADAPATAADICKAAADKFPRDTIFAPNELMSRIHALGVTLSDKDAGTVDTSCKMMALPGMGGFAALPMLHLGARDGSGIDLVLQIGQRDGACQAIVINLKGC